MAYSLTAVTYKRQRLFTGWQEAQPVVTALKTAQVRGEADTLAWVLMPDHLHWMVVLRRGSLAELMRKLKARASVKIGKAAHPVWQNGFHDRALRDDRAIVAAARYVIANPLRAGLVERVGDYPLWDAVWLGDPYGVLGD